MHFNDYAIFLLYLSHNIIGLTVWLRKFCSMQTSNLVLPEEHVHSLMNDDCTDVIVIRSQFEHCFQTWRSSNESNDYKFDAFQKEYIMK